MKFRTPITVISCVKVQWENPYEVLNYFFLNWIIKFKYYKTYKLLDFITFKQIWHKNKWKIEIKIYN